jgi:hypothetical protein
METVNHDRTRFGRKPSRTVAAFFGALAAFLVFSRIPDFRPSELAVATSRTPGAVAAPTEPPRLLFITLDGVRVDEFADCAMAANLAKSDCSFPKLWTEIRAGRFEASGMLVGNSRNLSLPGYQTIYSGAAQETTCPDNQNCAQVPVRTWLEKIRYARGVLPYEVAVIASWNKMPLAVEKDPGNLYVNAGVVDLMDPTRDGEIPKELATENRLQSRDLPDWPNARADRFTFAYARWYLAHLRPQVLVMGLLDSDELAHQDRYDAYREKLRTFDGYIQTLIQDLKDAKLYENMIVFVTTDHGRGSGYFGYAFRGHGPEWYLEHSRYGWAAISVPPALRSRWEPLRAKLLDHAITQRDIRPVIEGLMIPVR